MSPLPGLVAPLAALLLGTLAVSPSPPSGPSSVVAPLPPHRPSLVTPSPPSGWRASSEWPASSGGPPALETAGTGPSGPRSGPALRHGWQWPLAPIPVVLRTFEQPVSPWAPGHRGVDLAGAPGQEVRAATAGLVTHAAVVAGRPTISVLHRGGIRTTYQPVRATVQPGQRVAAGAPLGSLAAAGSHCAPSACLHFGAVRGTTYLDPLALLRAGPVILLPVR